MAKKRMNLGGFSWKRLTGVTKAKQGFSRKLGIPLTKGGRQRKVGKSIGCSVILLFIVVAFITSISYGYVLNTSTKVAHAGDGCHRARQIKPENYQVSNTIPAGYKPCGVCNPHLTRERETVKVSANPVEKPERITNQAVKASTIIPSKPSIENQRTTTRQTIPYTKPKIEWGWIQVEKVIDGNTLLLENGTKVRFIGVETPKIINPHFEDEPFGPEAHEFTKDLIEKAKSKIYIEKDGDAIDRYDRQLAMVYIVLKENDDDITYFLNEELLWEGLAKVRINDDYSQKIKDLFIKRENEAKRDKVGIWSISQ